MEVICFPSRRVLEINTYILATEMGLKAPPDIGKLEGALSRIDNAILYEGLDDIFKMAAFYGQSISIAHAFSDANKRTALAVAPECLSLNDFEIAADKELMADAMVDLEISTIDRHFFADILYAHYCNN